MRKIAIVALIASALSASAFAGETYVVGSVGQSDFGISKGRLDNALINSGATNLGSNIDNTDTAWKLQVGYKFNENFAVEGGYFDLGKAKYSASATQGTANADAKVDGFNVSAVGILPVAKDVNLFAKVGLAAVRTEYHASGGGLVLNANGTKNQIRPVYGIGASYDINKQVSLVAEYEQYNGLGGGTVGTANVNVLSAGVAYKF